MKGLGIESEIKCPGAKTRYPSIADFFIAKLTN